MATAFYKKGQLVRVSAEYQDATGAYVDPSGVTVKYKNPAGVTTTLVYPTDTAVVKDAVGKYHADINANLVGVWFYRWESSGANQAAEEDQFEVPASQF